MVPGYDDEIVGENEIHIESITYFCLSTESH